MGFTLSVPDRQYRLDSEAAQGPQTPTDPSMFQGTGAAVGTSVVGGLGATARTVGDTLAASARANAEIGLIENPWADPTGEGLRQLHAEPVSRGNDDAMQALQDWAKADPTTQGSGARALGGITRGLTIMGTGSLFGGPIAAAGTLAGVEGYNTLRDVQQGPNPVDQTTALKMAGVTAGFAGAGAFLPLSIGKGAAAGLLGLGMKAEAAGSEALATSYYGAARAAATVATNPIARLGTAALANTGFGAANRFAASTVLEDAGYKDMAAQYAPLDAQALASDFIMGLAFGGHAEISEHLAGRALNGEAKPPASIVDAALATRRQEMLARNSGGIPIDPAHANLDAGLQDGALANLLRGREVSVSPENARSVVDGTVRDPGVRELNDEFLQSMQAHYGALADFSDITRAPESPPQTTSDVIARAALPDAAAPDVPAAMAGALPHLSDYTNESLRQISARNPDLPVDVGNGVQVRAADLHQAMAADLAAANDTAKLHDAALACFART